MFTSQWAAIGLQQGTARLDQPLPRWAAAAPNTFAAWWILLIAGGSARDGNGSAMDERQAITRLQHGDIDGLEYLVRRYQALALEAAVLVCRDAALAEDIVQAAFVRAYERSHQVDPARPFGPWFLRGVVNDALKAVTRRRSVPLDPAALPLSHAASREPGPEELLAAAETQAAVWAAIERLTPTQRAAVVLRYYLDLSDAEVARRLTLPPGTVRRRLHDARRRLRQLLPAWVRPAAGDGASDRRC